MVPHGVPLRKAEEAMATLFYKTSRSYKPQGQTPQGHTSELHDSPGTFQLLLEVEARRSKRLEVSLGYRETLSQSKQESKQTNSKEKKKRKEEEERKKAKFSTVRSVENVFLSMKGLPNASWNYSWASVPWHWQSGPHISTSDTGKLSTSHSDYLRREQHRLFLINIIQADEEPSNTEHWSFSPHIILSDLQLWIWGLPLKVLLGAFSEICRSYDMAFHPWTDGSCGYIHRWAA